MAEDGTYRGKKSRKPNFERKHLTAKNKQIDER